MLRHPHRVACVADRISSRNKLKFFCSKPAAPRSAMTPCHSCATCQESKRRGSEHLVPSQEEELLSWCCKGRRLACEGRRWVLGRCVKVAAALMESGFGGRSCGLSRW